MPTSAYMSIEGARQGLVTQRSFTKESVGSIYQEGHEDEIRVQAFSHKILLTRDPHSGQPTGQRVHQPVTVTKVFDRASPLLYLALATGERLTKVMLRWYRTAIADTQEHYFTHAFEDAILVDIKAYTPNCQDPATASLTQLEDISFTYRKVTWTHEIAGTSSSDEWRARRS